MKSLKPFASILIIAIIVGIIPKFALAEAPLPEPGEEQGFLQPVEQKTEVPEGYIGIYTAEDMDNIRNNLSGKYILMADIDLTPLGNWQPIGQCKKGTQNPEYDPSHPSNYPIFIDDRIPFKGEIDGNGHVIENMNIKIDNTGDSFVSVGLIASAEDAVVKNLGIASASLEGKADITISYGGIFGEYCRCTLENCYNSASFTVDNVTAEFINVFGFVAKAHVPHGMPVNERYEKLLKIVDCVNYGDITIVEEEGVDFGSISLAGIGGFNIQNCINTGNIEIKISGKHECGADIGIGGITVGTSPVYDSVNKGNVSVDIEDASFDGLCWIACSGVVSAGGAPVEMNMPTENCKNEGDVSVKLKDCFTTWYFYVQVGGIGAHVDFAAGKDLANEGKISVEVENMTALSESPLGYTGEICLINAGGIFGTHHGSGSEYLNRCYNAGDIDVKVKDVEEGTAIHVGGICGGFGEEGSNPDKGHHMYLANCYNLGIINVESTGITYVGGISSYLSLAGRFENDPVAYIENCYNAGKINATGSELKIGAIAGFVLADNSSDGDILKIRNMYYSNTDLPCVGQSSGRVRFENNKQLTDSEMKKKSSFTGFNFVKVWGIDESRNGGYPYLRAFYGETGEAELGDVNMDGTVNTGDAVQILKHSADMISFDDDQLIAANTNRDDKVNTADAVLILKYVAGMITEF